MDSDRVMIRSAVDTKEYNREDISASILCYQSFIIVKHKIERKLMEIITEKHIPVLNIIHKNLNFNHLQLFQCPYANILAGKSVNYFRTKWTMIDISVQRQKMIFFKQK